jgi:hypothetical protein
MYCILHLSLFQMGFNFCLSLVWLKPSSGKPILLYFDVVLVSKVKDEIQHETPYRYQTFSMAGLSS